MGRPRRWPLARAASENPYILPGKPPLRASVEARHRAGLTQQQLAKKLRRHKSFVAKYEYEGGERRIDVLEFLTITRAIAQIRFGC
jgi:DNA-binding XRE family transcriptional regulator